MHIRKTCSLFRFRVKVGVAVRHMNRLKSGIIFEEVQGNNFSRNQR